MFFAIFAFGINALLGRTIITGGDIVAKFFTENKDVKDEFEKLPLAVKNSIIESGVEINSVEELKKAARSIKDNM